MKPWHPVIELIAARAAAGSRAGTRADGARLALVIEGGGMRGAITGGMALALEELGLTNVFDDVYGASAGALNAAWLVSEAAASGMAGWTDPALRMATIRRRNALRTALGGFGAPWIWRFCGTGAPRQPVPASQSRVARMGRLGLTVGLPAWWERKGSR